jgi:hypothetical protein
MPRRLKGRYDVTDLHALPALLPIPSLDCHIIASSQDNACGRVDGETSDVVRMCLEGGYFLVGVVVEDAKLEIVRAGDEPVLTRDELDASNGDL